MIQKKWNKKIASILIAFLFGLQMQPFLLSVAYAEAEGEQAASVIDTVTVSESTIPETETPQVSSQEPGIVEQGTGQIEVQTSVAEDSNSNEVVTSSSSNVTEGITTTATTTQHLAEILATSTPEFPDFISTSTTTFAFTSTSSTPLHASSTEAGIPENATTTSTSTEEDDDIDEGENNGDLPSGTTTIATGDSVALANILNIVNTNLINSTGSIVMANMYDGYHGTIDFRNSTSLSSSSCTLSGCNGVDSITANINADASIDNVIAVVATTGGNVIDTAESAVIHTGNTIAGLNLVNVANTNFIDSSYFLLSLNAFNTIHGDIVLPSLASLFSNANTTGAHIDASHINHSATVSNNLDVSANAGGNSTEALEGVIHSGNSNSVTNIYNNINSSLIGGSSISLLLKVSGTWIGQLFGLPFGNVFVEDGNSRIYHYEDGNLISGPGSTTIESTTTAAISNDVQVRADSGNNETLDTETSVISTGDSLAAANIINVANSNIVGRNWIMAIINVFGDLNGNISFGRPDLWVGEQVSANSTFIENGTQLTYKITVMNKGDMAATQAKASSKYDATHLTILDADVAYTETSPGVLQFEVGALAPNEAKEITISAVIKDTNPGTDITNISSIGAYEPDNNADDNTDSTTITTSVQSSGGGTQNTLSNNPSTITPRDPGTISISPLTVQVTRQNSLLAISGADTKGEQSLTIKNLTASTMPNVVFGDILYDNNGTNIQTEVFELGDILPFEEITVSYHISFSDSAEAGTYRLTSKLSQAGRGSLTYPNNGSIAFTKPESRIKQDEVATIVLSVSTSSVSVSLQSKAVATTALKNVTRKESVLGAFIDASSPQIAYAQGEDVATPKQRTVPNSLVYLILFLFAALLKIYYKYIYKQDAR